MNSDDSHQINSWLTLQSKKLQRAQQLISLDADDAKAISELENVVRSYAESANEGTIFQVVSGFENIVFEAQEALAAAYVGQGRYGEALFLHRYVAETVQSLVRGRRRNKEALKDVREADIDHLAKAALFLVHFSRLMSAKGNPEPASQLLDEAIQLSNTWHLNIKYPELSRMIDEQLNELDR
jgi:hypothetical protein